MKKINSILYNTSYFYSAYGITDIIKTCRNNSFKIRYKEIASFVPIKNKDIIVDFGCGNGDLCFYLNYMYGCKVIGLDYSKDAIEICNKQLKQYTKINKNHHVTFKHIQLSNLPSLDHITYIFFCDTVEHIDDKKLFNILTGIKKGNKSITLIIRTDNILFLRIIFPLLHFFNFLFGQISYAQYKNAFHFENIGHINLMSTFLLNKKMKRWGFKTIRISYPTISLSRIKQQFSICSKMSLVLYGIYIGALLFKFLSPTFYAVYQSIEMNGNE
jgi:SAM-dependent methyltransferase